jgi:hypothetical protein
MVMIIRIASALETRSAAAVLTHTAVVTNLEVVGGVPGGTVYYIYIRLRRDANDVKGPRDTSDTSDIDLVRHDDSDD